MRRELIHIQGMTCQSCVWKVSKAIMSLPGVEDVEVDLSKQNARFQLTNSQISVEDVINCIKSVGYEANRKKRVDWFYAWGLIVLVVVMMLSRRLLGFQRTITGSEISYGLLFTTGVLTSLHCVAMCGGITLSQVPVNESFRLRYVTLIQYNLGRLISYSLVGLILGAVGAIAVPNDKLRGLVTLVGGVGMAFLALSGIFPRWFSRVRLPNFSDQLIRSRILSRSSLGIGFINGFVPCGPLQGIQFYALGSGSALKGGLSMLIFGLGTLPLLMGFGTFVTLLSVRFRNRLIKMGYIFVLLLAFIMLIKGIGYII